MKKDTEQNYWFKRRRYGYGWTPASWQGWLVIIIFLAIVLGGAATIKDAPRNEFSNEVGVYLSIVLVTIVGLFLISHKKGPAPRWRWGKKDKDDPGEDF